MKQELIELQKRKETFSRLRNLLTKSIDDLNELQMNIASNCEHKNMKWSEEYNYYTCDECSARIEEGNGGYQVVYMTFHKLLKQSIEGE